MKAFDYLRPYILLLACILGITGLNASQRPLSESTKVNALIESVQKIGEGDLDFSLHMLDSALIISREANYVLGELKSLSLLGRYINGTGDYYRAIDTLNHAMAIAKKLNNIQAIATLNTRLAHCYQPMGFYQNATKLFLEAQKTFEKINHLHGQGVCANNLAIIYTRMRDTAAAFASYRQSLAISKSAEINRGSANTYMNMSYLFCEQGKYDSAWVAIQHADSIINQQQLTNHKGYLYSSKALYYRKQGDFKEAETQTRKALKEYQRLKLKFRIAGGYVKLGEILKIQKRIPEAIRNLRNGLALATQINAVEIQKTAWFQLSKTLEGQGRHKLALEALRSYQSIQADKIGPQLNSQLERVRTRYLVEKKDKELAQLTLGLEQKRLAVEKQKINLERQDLELSRSRMRLGLSLGSLALLGILVTFLALKYRDNRRHSLLLAEKQTLTETSLLEKEVLLGEIHHRVKNNLQMVYNMLDLQARHLDESQSQRAIHDSMSRVSTMALIHQKLYQQENVSGVRIAAYLEQLLNTLHMSYSSIDQFVDLQIEIEDIMLDINTTIPIGLIINELVTNAFKYAFNATKTGILQVSLHRDTDFLSLKIKDNGPGFSKEQKDSFGLQLVRSLSRQLKGKLSITSEKGTCVHLEIHQFNLVKT
ncbi:MAG TPA: tetratricopeptide repeat protein [Bacteroidetes bacterium]|nr:tetratricopeptide repeat protein [Bacteroidota bacterium]